MRRATRAARLALIAVIGVAIAAAACKADQNANLLLNGDVEKGKGDLPSIWFAAKVPADGLRMWRAATDCHAGKACLAISNQHQYEKPVSNNWAQELQQVPKGKKKRLSAYIRTADADTVNACVQCWAEGGKNMLAFATTPMLRGSNDWTLARAPEIVVPPETAFVIVRLALMGRGKAFFDDVSLEVVGDPLLPPGDAQLDRAVQGKVLRALPVVKDCMVLSYMQDWSHGDVDNIAVANNNGGVRTLLALPAVSPEEATRPNLKFILALYSRNTTSRPPAGAIQAHELLADWPERTSWKKLPAFAAKPFATFEFVPGDGWKLFDVTSLVRAKAKAGRKTYGIMLRFAEEERSGKERDWSGYAFVSREGLGEWENRRPLMLVVDTSAEPSTKPASSRSAT